MKILIMGASGSGTTTLAAQLSQRLDFVHLDADDFYWKKTFPPYHVKADFEERTNNLKAAFESSKKVIVSGSLVSWGEYWKTAFDLLVFIRMDPSTRMERLRKREVDRYGDLLETDETLQNRSQEFLMWASQYDDPTFKGRSISLHQHWINETDAEVLNLDGNQSLSQKTNLVLSRLGTI